MSKQARIRVLVKRVGEEPVIEEIYNTLEAKQALVGGWLECIPVEDGVYMWGNEEAKFQSLPANFKWIHEGSVWDIICGDVFFTGGADDEGYTISIDDVTESKARLFIVAGEDSVFQTVHPDRQGG